VPAFRRAEPGVVQYPVPDNGDFAAIAQHYRASAAAPVTGHGPRPKPMPKVGRAWWLAFHQGSRQPGASEAGIYPLRRSVVSSSFYRVAGQ